MPASAHKHNLLYKGRRVIFTLKQYILSVTSAAIIYGILSGLIKGHSFEKPFRFLCSLFLTFTILFPLQHAISFDLSAWQFHLPEDASAISQYGKNQYTNSIAEHIRTECAAYISSKAEAAGGDIDADILLNNADPPVPTSVILSGTISQEGKALLEKIIENDLGIPEEMQTWKLQNP